MPSLSHPVLVCPRILNPAFPVSGHQGEHGNDPSLRLRVFLSSCHQPLHGLTNEIARVRLLRFSPTFACPCSSFWLGLCVTSQNRAVALVRDHVRAAHRGGLRRGHHAAQRGHQARKLPVQHPQLFPVVSFVSLYLIFLLDCCCCFDTASDVLLLCWCSRRRQVRQERERDPDAMPHAMPPSIRA